jgi:hypothetical protein
MIIKTGIILSTINRTCFATGKRAAEVRNSELFAIVRQNRTNRNRAKHVQISSKSMILNGVMMKQMLGSFLRLCRADRRVVVRAALALLRPARHRNLSAGATGRLRLAHLVTRTAALLPVRATCLDRARVLATLLHDEGLHGEMRIAVRRDRDALSAHAWIEHGGLPLLEPPDPGFSTLERAR